MRPAYFGNGVRVTIDGVVRVDYRLPPGETLMSASKSFRQSLEEALAYAQQMANRLQPAPGNAPPPHARSNVVPLPPPKPADRS
jgi:hypothetical protein